MSTWFLKCICAFNRVLSCLRRTGESGVLGERWGLLGSCGYWQVAPLHQTGPGEVPMTCFIPTLVLCRKKWRGKSSHNSSICLKRLENKKKSPTVARPCECFCAAVSDREGKCAEKKDNLSLHWAQIGAQVLVKYSLCLQRKENHVTLSVFWMETASCHHCLNTVIGRWGARRERCDVVLPLLTNHTFLTSV